MWYHPIAGAVHIPFLAGEVPVLVWVEQFFNFSEEDTHNQFSGRSRCLRELDNPFRSFDLFIFAHVCSFLGMFSVCFVDVFCLFLRMYSVNAREGVTFSGTTIPHFRTE